ncbi:UPF0481 protein At3g47200 [Rosa chinensis]|nr:UPF0481 protein At3g47200 [Rosa chinensis]
MEGSSDIERGEVDESVQVHLEHRGMTVEHWKTTFNTEVLNAKSPLPATCCILKVHEVLRGQKEEAYKPNIVSIGPFHRGAEKFQLIENVKKWYLNCLLWRTETITLDSLIESIKEQEKKARGYYEPCFHLDQSDFIKMLILDGCFLIELFRKKSFVERQDENDPIFNVPCMLEYLYHDILLLENQLPWFVLEFFYDLIEGGLTGHRNSLSKLVIDFFKNSVADPNIFSNLNPNIFSNLNPESDFKILHILDLIRISLVEGLEDPSPHMEARTSDTFKLIRHLPQRIPSATALSEAGVKFEKVKGRPGCILNITFKNGVFTIPHLAIDERTGPLFRNLMAFEQCYHSCYHKITSYAFLMDNLIDTSKDVDLLCEKGIIGTLLSADDASKFFNELYHDATLNEFYYLRLCGKVQQYYKVPWNRWREKLRRDYFGTPWATISFFAALVLTVLTFLGTIYTILQYHHPS